jgi:hypothetical protein
MAAGRPTDCTDAMMSEICDTIGSSHLGLPTLCSINAHWPKYQTIFRWISENRNGFSDMYAKAKESQADFLTESILVVIDKPETYIDDNGQERNDVGMLRLKVDAFKWQASKLRPKKWGDKNTNEPQNASETLSKIQELVSDLNKTNTSDI